MKTTVKIVSLLFVIFVFACTKDEPVPQQQQQQEKTTPGPEPENQAPGSFSATAEVSKNTCQLNWTAAEDPDGDTITYSIMLGDSLVATLTETSFDLSGLVFEKDYQGKIIADDGNEHQVETAFNFTTGFLWLAKFEFDDFASSARTYEYDSNEKLITLNRPGNKINVVYDGAGRLFSYDYFTYSWNDAGKFTNISDGTGRGDLTLFYNENNQIEEMIIDRTGSNDYKAYEKVICTYNALGNLALINRQIIYFSDNSGSEQHYYHRIELRYDNAGNVTEKLTRVSENDIDYQLSSRYEYSYDTQKNPWNTIITRQFNFDSRIILGINQDIFFFSSPEFIQGYELHIALSEHNLTNIKYYNGESFLVEERRYEYTYNDSEYPITGKITAIEEDNQEEVSFSLEYLD